MAAAGEAIRSTLMRWESLVLKTAWDRLTLEGRLVASLAGSTCANDDRSPLT